MSNGQSYIIWKFNFIYYYSNLFIIYSPEEECNIFESLVQDEKSFIDCFLISMNLFQTNYEF